MAATKDVLSRATRERAEVLADALRDEGYVVGFNVELTGRISLDVFEDNPRKAANEGRWVATVFVRENGTIEVEDPPPWMALLSKSRGRSVRDAIRARGLGEWLR